MYSLKCACVPPFCVGLTVFIFPLNLQSKGLFFVAHSIFHRCDYLPVLQFDLNS